MVGGRIVPPAGDFWGGFAAGSLWLDKVPHQVRRTVSEGMMSSLPALVVWYLPLIWAWGKVRMR